MTDINVRLRGRGSVALYGRIVGYGHKALHYLRFARNDNFLVVIARRQGRRGNLTTRNDERGAVLLSVLFFALFFAVLISKIFSTLQETKASSPRIAGAQIERYVSETVMVNVINKCNEFRKTSPHAPGTPANVFAVGGIISSLISCSPPDNTGAAYTPGDCKVEHQVPVSMATFGGSGGTRLFIATATVTVIDLDTGGGFYQWDCGQLTIDANVQG